MAVAQTETEVVYSPSSLPSIFSSTLNDEFSGKVYKVRGIYTQGEGGSSGGFYYDKLKDDTSDASATLVVPGLIRSQLAQDQTIECYANLTKKIEQNGESIDLQLHVVELLSKTSGNRDAQIKSFAILERKAESGHKDVDSFIKSKLVNGEPITVNIITGKSAIVNEDIKHQLKEAIGFYKFYFTKINLASTKEIIQNLNYYQRKCQIIAIVAGVGDSLEIFNHPDIAEAALSLSIPFVTALGGKENVPLLQKVADKAFLTPAALGLYFNEIYNKTVVELQNSKAKLVEDITALLEANYRNQIDNLKNNLASLQKDSEKELIILSEQLQSAKEERTAFEHQIQDLQNQINKAAGRNLYTILFIITALIIGFLLGRLL